MKKKGIIILIMMIIGIGGYVLYSQNQRTEVSAFTVEQQALENYVEETAVIKGSDVRNILAKASGELTQLKGVEGQQVTAASVLAVIGDERVQLQIQQLEANQKELESLYRQALKPNEAELIREAQNYLDIADINLERAQLDLKNGQALAESGALTNKELDLLAESMAIATKQKEIAQNKLNLSKKSASKEVGIQIKAKIEALEKSMALLKEQTKDYRLLAPINGTITEMDYKEKDYILAGTRLCEIADLSEYFLETEILAADMKDVKLGSLVRIEDEEMDIHVNGKVVAISPKAYSKVSDLGIEQKRVKIKIKADEKNPHFKMNYEVDVKVVKQRKESATVIPNSAIFKKGDEHFVLMIANQTLELQKIDIGIEGDRYTEVVKGLALGDKIVSSPGEQLKAGMKVRLSE